MKVETTTLTIASTEIWAEVSKAGNYDLFIRVTGAGVPAGSDLHISATSATSGCDNMANFITYRPEGDTQYMPKSTKEPECGLTIEALPTAIGGRFKGTFNATLYGINSPTPVSKRVQLTFDVLRTK